MRAIDADIVQRVGTVENRSHLRDQSISSVHLIVDGDSLPRLTDIVIRATDIIEREPRPTKRVVEVNDLLSTMYQR